MRETVQPHKGKGDEMKGSEDTILYKEKLINKGLMGFQNVHM